MKQHIYRDYRIRSLTLICDDYWPKEYCSSSSTSTTTIDNNDMIGGVAVILTDSGQLRLIDLNDGRLVYVDESGENYVKLEASSDGKLCALNDDGEVRRKS